MYVPVFGGYAFGEAFCEGGESVGFRLIKAMMSALQNWIRRQWGGPEHRANEFINSIPLFA
jgi:hypothetical protein